jgi:hypothetical protein
MKYLEKDLALEIKERYEFLNNIDRIGVISKCRELMRKNIEKDSCIHSYRITHPRGDIPFSIPHNLKRKIPVPEISIPGERVKKVKLNKGIKRLESAFEWGRVHFSPSNFDEYFLKEIAAKICPDVYPGEIASYRNTDMVNLNDTRFMAPSSYKIITREIPEFIDHIKKQLASEDVIETVETAIYSHLHIARMQPFIEANKRTARTIQNLILYSKDIPSPIIETGERALYLDYFEKAAIGWNEMIALDKKGEVSDGEKLFYNYIASKINSSLDKIITSCYPR